MTAIDGIVNVNSLFTVAVFVGLSLSPPAPEHQSSRSHYQESKCVAGPEVSRMLTVYEVVSFSFFLFSSLVAQGVKLAINLKNSVVVDDEFKAHFNANLLRCLMIASAAGSVIGCLFLMLSMVKVVEIQMGILSCGNEHVLQAVASMVVFVTSGLVVYISTVTYAFCH